MKISPIILALALCGCISTGHKLDSSRIEDIKPGQTKVHDLAAMFGEPWSEKKQKDGTTRYVWQYTRGGFGVGVVEQQVLTVYAHQDGTVKEFYVKNKAD